MYVFNSTPVLVHIIDKETQDNFFDKKLGVIKNNQCNYEKIENT